MEAEKMAPDVSDISNIVIMHFQLLPDPEGSSTPHVLGLKYGQFQHESVTHVLPYLINE